MSEHKEECDCIFCRNPQIEEYIKEITELINGEEERKVRAGAVKSIIHVFLSLTKISLVDRVGLLNIISHDLIDNAREFQIQQQLGLQLKQSLVNGEGDVSYVS